MKDKDLAKIDTNCCSHGFKSEYIIGYTGFKCCKIAMCTKCDKRQFIGNWFGKLLYPLARKIWHNRLVVVDRVKAVELLLGVRA